MAERSVALADEKGLRFPLLSDAGNLVAASFGLRHELPADLRALYTQFGIDLAATNGDDSWTLPMPARYVIDTGGVIRDAHVHADYTLRPEPTGIVGILAAL